jgi:hypothetical protein
VSIARGRPYCDDEWVTQTVKALNLEHAVRREGRPRKGNRSDTDSAGYSAREPSRKIGSVRPPASSAGVVTNCVRVSVPARDRTSGAHGCGFLRPRGTTGLTHRSSALGLQIANIIVSTRYINLASRSVRRKHDPDRHTDRRCRAGPPDARPPSHRGCRGDEQKSWKKSGEGCGVIRRASDLLCERGDEGSRRRPAGRRHRQGRVSS